MAAVKFRGRIWSSGAHIDALDDCLDELSRGDPERREAIADAMDSDREPVVFGRVQYRMVDSGAYVPLYSTFKPCTGPGQYDAGTEDWRSQYVEHVQKGHRAATYWDHN